MRLRSTVYFLFFFIACVLVINLVLGLFKQIISQKKMNFYLEQKKTELAKLEAENEELKKKLEETEKPGFLNREASRLFGFTRDGVWVEAPKTEEEPKKAVNLVEIPNYQKWLNLFGF